MSVLTPPKGTVTADAGSDAAFSQAWSDRPTSELIERISTLTGRDIERDELLPLKRFAVDPIRNSLARLLNRRAAGEGQ